MAARVALRPEHGVADMHHAARDADLAQDVGEQPGVEMMGVVDVPE